MADNAKLIGDAGDYAKELNDVAGKANVQTQLVEKAVKANPPSLEGIRAATTAAGKPLVGWDKTYAEAEKLLPAVQKLKDASAQLAARNLNDAMAKAGKALTGLHGTIDMADKIADKANKEDAALGGTLDKVIKAAEESSRQLASFIIGFPGQLELLSGNFDKVKAGKLPAQALKNSVPLVSTNMKNAGAEITTATSVHSSMGPIVKKGEAAYIAEVRVKAREGAVLEKKLGEQITKARALLNDGLKEVKTYQDYLKKVG